MTNPKLAIHERDPELSNFMRDWQLNRDMVEGERCAKPGTPRYPQYSPYLTPDPDLTPAQNKRIVGITPFFPGTSRIHGGLIGQMFRRAASVECPEGVKDILETITADGLTIDDLAKRVVSEEILTNYVGMLTDYPVTPVGLTKAKAIELGIRPLIGLYKAESILGIETGMINERRRPIRIRLQDDATTIRELRIDNGIYTVTIWKANGKDWSIDRTFTPTREKDFVIEKLDEIPFTIVNTDGLYLPSKAPIHDAARLNQQHFMASSNLAVADYWVSRPVPYIFGKGATTDEKISIAPGIIWRSEDPTTKAGMVEYSGASISQLAARVDTIQLDMSKTLGGNILQNDKASAEAAETLAIRKNSDHASIAAIARIASRGINDQLKWVAWWMGMEEGDISYELNTDYNAAPLSNVDITARQGLVDGQLISKDAFIDMMIEHEVLPENFDREADAAKISEEIADRPTLEVAKDIDTVEPDAVD